MPAASVSARGADVCVCVCGVAQEVFAKDAASGIADVVKGMLDLDPKKRLTPREALRMPFFQSQSQPQSNSQERDGRRR